MCLPCWPITKASYERGKKQCNSPQRYHWHWSRSRNMWILRDTVRKRCCCVVGCSQPCLRGGWT
ncbi:hypothetical protein QBC36DRAFT_180521 [Triangularia setosa]|uniref:Uncharacterized protein n=1 Tax=Triangularia setosa TaxID=2587417 RepID=A0AAN6WDQ5_9PEZI|nr:hypothetical protein QBC36DRAFT_180521 [Podospora setosa]